MSKKFSSKKTLLPYFDKTHLFLIPKTKSPKDPSEFRPIGLCNTSYKIISKLLANRMKSLLDKVISLYQSTFLSSRQISDNIVVAHEIVHLMKKKKGKVGWLGVKIDMSKAFDRVS